MCHHRSRSAKWVITLLTAILLSNQRLSAQVSDPNTPPATPAQEQPEVLSRGPVHEAFAEPVTMQLQAGLIAPQQPPANIEEVPPADKPQGSQFVWIPGYWSWDADRSGYIWVSACWRAAPPSMSWVPGYWAQVPGGWEWISGYWAPASVRNIAYLPAPPAVEDIEPVGIQSSPDMIWVPPCMYWSDGQYIRRAGYWLKAQPNWVWIPSHYVMTPRGCIFAEGHWDYALEHRGVLFAPVYFPASVYHRVAFTYSPSVVIDVGLLQVSLFAYPRYCHYYFGDYYDSAYLSVGIFPWFECRKYHTWYDPVYEHDRWRYHHSEPRWEEHERDEYRRRCDDKDLRPARTFHEQESRLSKLPEPQRHASQLVQPIETAVTSRRNPSIKFEKIDTDARQKISRQSTAVHTFSDDRNRWESPEAAPKTAQPSENHKTTAIPSEHKQTIPTDWSHKTTVMPQAEHRQTVQPTEERKNPVTPSTERKRSILPTDEHKTVVMPAIDQKQTILPLEEHKTTVTPSIEHKRSIQPYDEHKTTMSSSTEHRQMIEPAKQIESPPVSTPNIQQKHKFIPPSETQVSRPDRIQIPASPVVGNSGQQGFFRKSPPKLPSAESKDHTETEPSRDK